MYQEKLRELKRQGLIGMGIGAVISVILLVWFLNEYEDKSMIWLILFIGVVWTFGFAGIVYGWVLTGRLIRETVILGTPIGLILIFVLRLAVALMIGLFIYPIVLLYISIKARWEKKESHRKEIIDTL